MSDIRETHDRLGRAQAYGQDGNARYKTEAQLATRKEQRKRFQFDATASDDELEDEIDDNLNEISDMTKRLKALGSAMGQELDRQNERIEVITQKTDSLDNRIFRNTKKVRYRNVCQVILTNTRRSWRGSSRGVKPSLHTF